MKINKQLTQERQRKGFTLVELLVVIGIISTLGALAFGPIMRHINTGDRTKAMSNGRNLHSALLGFSSENGNTFPTDATLRAGGTVATPEDAFQQLLEGGNVGEEKYFWNIANGRGGTCAMTPPDENGTLVAGENAWGYVKDLDPGNDGKSPLIYDSCTGVTGNTGTFTTLPWKGKAIIVKVDSSCEAKNITYTGEALGPNGAAKNGPVQENQGGTAVDVFAAVPDYATPLATSQ